ncbi:TAXI family TRAP transporter solute-binding subunit [Stella sp.]|uniref:TAXI family TRAP transporter solute-binding subunit n=1 Tax=Stella sp. TaxID=2912054 RepID=UPI0035B0B574
MRLIVTAALAVALTPFAASAQMPAPKQQFMSMATSSVGGSWFPLGGAMAKVIGDAYPQLKITAEVTGGTADNLKLLKNGQVELALSTNDMAYLAAKGEGPFKGAAISNFKGLLGGHAIIWQVYTLKSSGIRSLKDFKGKRLSLGAAGSIGGPTGQIVMEAYGLKMNTDWKPEYLGHGDGPGALLDGRVDGVLIISSAPTAAVTDITSRRGEEVVFLNPEKEILDKLIEKHPYWFPAVIPGGAYKGHPNDIPNSFGSATILVAHEKVSDEAAYATVKALIENHGKLVAANALAKEWSRENATRGIAGVMPFHPGAEKYLKEAGVLK